MWTFLIIVGILINIHIASTRGSTFRIIAFIITFWEAFIYLLTALKNPGIHTSKNQLVVPDVKYNNDAK